MGWTKRADAVLSHKQSLKEKRQALRKLRSNLESRKDLFLAARLLREHEVLCSYLAYGQRDGTVKTELGVSLSYKHCDLGEITEELIDNISDSYHFRVKEEE